MNPKNLALCILILLGVFAFMYIKVEMYGGDISCLVVKCVKVVP